MGSPTDGNPGLMGFGIVAVGGLLAAIFYGVIFLPPYFANREVQSILENVALAMDPTIDDERIISEVNSRLFNVHVSSYSVDDDGGGQKTGSLSFDADSLTITHDDNQTLELDADYTQTVWIPIFKRIYPIHYHCHAEAHH